MPEFGTPASNFGKTACDARPFVNGVSWSIGKIKTNFGKVNDGSALILARKLVPYRPAILRKSLEEPREDFHAPDFCRGLLKANPQAAAILLLMANAAIRNCRSARVGSHPKFRLHRTEWVWVLEPSAAPARMDSGYRNPAQ